MSQRTMTAYFTPFLLHRDLHRTAVAVELRGVHALQFRDARLVRATQLDSR